MNYNHILEKCHSADLGWKFFVVPSAFSTEFRIGATRGNRTLYSKVFNPERLATSDFEIVDFLIRVRDDGLFPTPRICFVGPSRSGKDEAAMELHGRGMFRFFGSTSWAALPDVAAALNLPQQVAWETRHDHRDFWKTHCDWLRRNDECFLIQRVLQGGNICSGVRDRVEIEKAIREGLFERIIWIDRPGTPDDPTLTFTRSVATDIIRNDQSLEIFRARIQTWATLRGYLPRNKAAEELAGRNLYWLNR